MDRGGPVLQPNKNRTSIAPDGDTYRVADLEGKPSEFHGGQPNRIDLLQADQTEL